MVQFQNYKKFKLLKVGEYMKTIVRKNYLNRIIELKDTPDIKIITGIRRSGKSKLMQAYIEYLKTNCDNINIIFIDFMDLEFEEIKEYHALHSYVEQHYEAGKINNIEVILEIQEKISKIDNLEIKKLEEWENKSKELEEI